MAVEEELRRDHAEMQAVIEAKQKIIDAQVQTHPWHACVTPVPRLCHVCGTPVAHPWHGCGTGNGFQREAVMRRVRAAAVTETLNLLKRLTVSPLISGQ